MAEQGDSHPRETDDAVASAPSRRSMRAEPAKSSPPRRSFREPMQAMTARILRPGSIAKPARNLVILAMVAGLIAPVALSASANTTLPAYASDGVTIEQVAADNAQSLVVASDVVTTDLSRNSYAATTAEELAARKAAEAAAARSVGSAAALSSVNLSMVAPGSGEVRWPLDMSAITVGRGFGSDGYHEGVDLLGAFGTYEYAAAAGVVSFAGVTGGYGQVVFIDHVINGVSVSTAYAHMSTILVSAGQSVGVGQVIGLMGMTGSATANHLHFEVRINGGLVDPWAWLVQNAG